ncbi:MAG: hypothetical protein V1494_07020 [Candidatus Diapherotrites archaeon]
MFGFNGNAAKHSDVQKNLLPQLIKPSFVENEVDCIKVNGNFNRVIAVVGYPRIIREGWLNAIVSSDGDILI